MLLNVNACCSMLFLLLSFPFFPAVVVLAVCHVDVGPVVNVLVVVVLLMLFLLWWLFLKLVH